MFFYLRNLFHCFAKTLGIIIEGRRLSSSCRCPFLQSREDKHPKEHVFGLPSPCLNLRHLLSKEYLRNMSSISEITKNAKLIRERECMLIIIPQWDLSWRICWTSRADLPVTLHLCMSTHLLCCTCPSCPRVLFCGNPWEHLIVVFKRQFLVFKHCKIS